MKVRYKLKKMERKAQQEQPLRYYRRLPLALICSLTILLSACSLFPAPSQTGAGVDFTTPTVSSTGTVSATPSFKPSPITLLPLVNCPSLSINWDSLIGTKANVNKAQK